MDPAREPSSRRRAGACNDGAAVASSRRIARWAAVAAFGAALAKTIACSTGDQVCTPTSDLEKKNDDDCPYGPPGGPAVTLTDCPPIDFKPPTDPSCAGATWESAYAVLVDPARGGCAGSPAGSGCHAPADPAMTPPFGVAIPAADAAQAYKNLLDYTGSKAVPYLGAGRKDAWILCNLGAQKGGGYAMPPPNGLTTSADLAAVTAWVECGMPAPGAGAGGGGAGGGI